MATNLEALTEEDDEEYDVMTDDSVSEDDEAGDGGVRKGEPNKFDGLCDGVVNAVSLTHGALAELLELKDELLKHALPPNVLMKIALCTTKVFRSMSDMQSPVNELLRMVRLYSTPWEEKSAALKKLHEDYNSKKEQLNIAVKRLQLIDAHSKRLEKERRIMNWEKLFSRLTAKGGHGRRWKFLIESFKKHASEGQDSLRAYVEEVEQKAVEAEGEERDIETQLQHHPPSPSEDPASDQHTRGEQTEDESEAEDEENSAMKDVDADLESLDSAHKEQEREAPVYLRPPMRDKECWTHEPEYERYLHVRVYKPEGLDARELRCALTLGKQFHKTDILDPVPEEEEDENKPASPVKSVTPDGRPSRPVRGRGRGRAPGGPRGRGSRPGAAKGSHLMQHPQEQLKEEKKPEGPRYEECVFKLEPETREVRPRSKKGQKNGAEEPQHLKVSVHYGPKEEMVAMATIEMEDFESLELPTVAMKPPVGDRFPVVREEYDPTPAPTTPGLTATFTFTPTDSTTGPTPDIRNVDPEKVLAMLSEATPVNFPLYSIHTAVTDAVHMPAGQLPLVCFWAKKLKPATFDRATDSETVRDIIYDATGYDMDVVRKEDLHKEMREQNLSAMSCHSDAKDESAPPPEPMVTKAQYDRLMNVHKEEMESLQEEYEQKLQDLVEQFQQIQEAMMNSQGSAANSPHQLQRPDSGGRHLTMSPVNLPAQGEPQKPRRAKTDLMQSLSKPRKNFSVGRPLPNWGENLPKDFFERLKLFEAESRKHQEEVADKQRLAMQQMLEKKFAAEFKLSNPEAGDFNAMEDVSLPAVFMPPTKSGKASVYNPRAAKYFHASGAGGARLTQPPSMLQLPPIPSNRLSVINLFDVAKNFHRGGNQWLMDRYMSGQQRKQTAENAGLEPRTPPPTYTTEAIRESASVTVGASPQKEAMLD